MVWKVEVSQSAAKQIAKLDKAAQQRIYGFLTVKLQASPDPRQLGKALQGDKRGLWRYRVGDYRLICDLQDQRLVVLLLIVAHRKDVYR
ncbi:MAG: type II toxin-antitoxin system RelE/ParE family toxin [Terriglobales bacterium]